MDLIRSSTLELPKTIQNYIFFKVWEAKGSILGVHNDFGKLSFFHSSMLSTNYYCTKEEQTELLLILNNIIEEITSIK
jgi:hypothetical protein